MGEVVGVGVLPARLVAAEGGVGGVGLGVQKEEGVGRGVGGEQWRRAWQCLLKALQEGFVILALLTPLWQSAWMCVRSASLYESN